MQRLQRDFEIYTVLCCGGLNCEGLVENGVDLEDGPDLTTLLWDYSEAGILLREADPCNIAQ